MWCQAARRSLCGVALRESTMRNDKYTTERLIIREYTKKDLDDFLRVVRQPGIYRTTYGIPRDYSRLRAKKWLGFIKRNIRSMQSYEYGMFLRDSGEYIGNIGLINVSMTHNHAEISYYIDEAHRGLGLTTEAAREMLRLGFETFGFEKISGLCMAVNIASRRVMEKIGMTYEGTSRRELLKDGVYYDIDRLSILRNEYFTECKA